MSIRIFLDDAPTPIREIQNGERFELDTTGLPDGAHRLRIEYLEDGRVTGVREVPFTVRNGPGIAVAGLDAGDEVRGTVGVRVNASDAGINSRLDVHALETHRGIPFWMGGFALTVILATALYVATDPFRHRDYADLEQRVAALTGATAPRPVALPDAGVVAAVGGTATADAAPAQPPSPLAYAVSAGDYLPIMPIRDKPADAARGGTLFAARCSGCHGADGEGTVQEKVTLGEEGVYPRLAGQSRTYIYRQLVSFAEGWRESAEMHPMALSVDEQDRLDIAAFVEGLEAPYPPRPTISTDQLALGASIARIGRIERGVSRCSACHGPNGLGGGDNFPYLAGQNADYLASQIAKWKDGRRRNAWLHLMRPVAAGLTEEEATAIALYYAQLRPAERRQAAVQ